MSDTLALHHTRKNEKGEDEMVLNDGSPLETTTGLREPVAEHKEE